MRTILVTPLENCVVCPLLHKQQKCHDLRGNPVFSITITINKKKKETKTKHLFYSKPDVFIANASDWATKRTTYLHKKSYETYGSHPSSMAEDTKPEHFKYLLMAI